MNPVHESDPISRFHTRVVYASLSIALVSLLVVALMLWHQQEENKKLIGLLMEAQIRMQSAMADINQQQHRQESFATRHAFYQQFMSNAIDAYFHLERQNRQALQEDLVQLDKTYYALAPFLNEATRDQLRAELAEFADLALQASNPWQELKQNLELQKKKTDTMIDAMNSRLFSALFKNDDFLDPVAPMGREPEVKYDDQKETDAKKEIEKENAQEK